MKILEAQSATLTNYEVYTHLTELKRDLDKREAKQKGPGNLQTVVKEMLDYLRTAPSPLGETPIPYTPNSIKTLLQRLRPYNLTKAEVLMIMNHRPTTVAALNTIVEELEQRFEDEAMQEEMVAIIIEVLGSPDASAEAEKMTKTAKDAREKRTEELHENGEGMEVDS